MLVNSLCSHGFKGEIYAGYRGGLPEWSVKIGRQNLDFANQRLNAWSSVEVTESVRLVLVPVSFEGHLTNRKPDFMLQLFEESPFDIDSLFYMDPDLLVNAPWKFFMEWMSCGVAVCEDINSPLPVFSPQRIGWRREFAKFGISLQPNDACYANGGFVGVSRQSLEFLLLWKRIQDCIWSMLGGRNLPAFLAANQLTIKVVFVVVLPKRIKMHSMLPLKLAAKFP